MKFKTLVILGILVTSCNQVRYSPKPDRFLDKDKMAAVMADIYLIEGALATNQTAFLNTKTLPHKFVYKKHKIDSVTFQKNFAYYADRPEDYEEILKRTNERLANQRKNLEELIEIENKQNEVTPVTADSLIELKPIVK